MTPKQEPQRQQKRKGNLMTTTTRLLTLCVLTIPLATLSAWAGANDTKDNPEARTVHVAGTAIVRVVPDIVVWNLTIDETNPVLKDAKQSSDGKMSRLLSTATGLGVAPEDLSTSSMDVHRVYYLDEAGNRGEFRYWEVRRAISLKERDLARFDEFFGQLMDAGDFEAEYRFETSRFHELRTKARMNATKAAKEKAQAMCEGAGAQLGQAVKLDEQPSRYLAPWQQPISNVAVTVETEGGAADAEESPAGTLAPGMVEVSVTVYATFEIV
jgi:uncharacterized protein